MTLKLDVIRTGQLGNNVCILYDDQTKVAFVIDPSFEPSQLLKFIEQQGLTVQKVLLTHGHFDHFAGVAFLVSNLSVKPKIGLHHNDLDLLRDGGGSKNFHMQIAPPGEPDFFLEDRQILELGGSEIQVRLTPGHTPGSVIFYLPELRTAICGDLIFYHSVGRTDLREGNFDVLQTSIREQVYTLPPETRLIPGHGEWTTVLEEMENNPFVNVVERGF